MYALFVVVMYEILQNTKGWEETVRGELRLGYDSQIDYRSSAAAGVLNLFILDMQDLS